MKQVVLDLLLAVTGLPLAAYTYTGDLARETSRLDTAVPLAVMIWVCAMAYCAVLQLYLKALEKAKPEETLESAPEKEIIYGQKICAVMLVVNTLGVAIKIMQMYGVF